MKRLALYTAVVLATLTGVALVWEFRLIAGVFILSLLVAAAVRPLIARLAARGLPPVVAQVAVYVLVIGGLVVAFVLLSVPLLGEIQTLSNSLTYEYEVAYLRWTEGTATEQAVAARLLPPSEFYEVLAGAEGDVLPRAVIGATGGILALTGGILLVLVLSVYWNIDQARFERLWLSLLLPRHRTAARHAWRAVETASGSYVRSELFQSAVAALVLGLGYWAMGLQYPVLLAILAGLAWLVPLLGVVLITVPAFLVGWEVAPLLGYADAGYTLLVLVLLELVVEPRLFDRRRNYGLVVILLVLPLVDAYGVVGLVVAPPVAVAVTVLVRELFDYFVTSRSRLLEIDELQKRSRKLREQLEREEGSPEAESLLNRLDKLLEEAGSLTPPPSWTVRNGGTGSGSGSYSP